MSGVFSGKWIDAIRGPGALAVVGSGLLPALVVVCVSLIVTPALIGHASYHAYRTMTLDD